MTTNPSPNLLDIQQRLKQLAEHIPTPQGDMLDQQWACLRFVCANNPSAPSPAPTDPEAAEARLRAQAQQFDRADNVHKAVLLKAIRQLTPLSTRYDLLAQVMHNLPPAAYRQIAAEMQQALHTIKAQDPAAFVRVLMRILPVVARPPKQKVSAFSAVYEMAQDIEDEEGRIRSLIALSQYMPDDVARDLQASVLAVIRELHDDTHRTNAIVALSEVLHTAHIEDTLAITADIIAPEDRLRALTALAKRTVSDLPQRVQDDALTALEAITSEEARVEALIAFAPHLDYNLSMQQFPNVLERALAVAVGITRRPQRARALVALAPHLPTELQGEALAAVHSLPHEKDRAIMLAELARELPPNMLVASLAVAHTMQQQDARVHALTALAQHVPQQARRQTLLDALDAARGLPRPFERVHALVELVDLLPVNIQDTALADALETAAAITNESARSRALSLLLDRLPGHLIPQAQQIVAQLNDPQHKLSALAGLMPRIDENEQKTTFEEMLAITQAIPVEFRRARALLGIAPHLPPTMIEPTLDIARTIDEPYDRFSALMALIQNAPPRYRPQLVGEAWNLIHQVESGYDRASALASIAPLLPPQAEADLTQAISDAIGEIQEGYDQASAILMLAPLLAKAQPTEQDTDRPDACNLIKDALTALADIPHTQARIACLDDVIATWVAHIPKDERSAHDDLWETMINAVMQWPLADAWLWLSAIRPLMHHLYAEAGERMLIETLYRRDEYPLL